MIISTVNFINLIDTFCNGKRLINFCSSISKELMIKIHMKNVKEGEIYCKIYK